MKRILTSSYAYFKQLYVCTNIPLILHSIMYNLISFIVYCLARIEYFATL